MSEKSPAEMVAELDALYEKATKGEWHAMPKPAASYSDHGFRLVAETAQRHAANVYGEADAMWREGDGWMPQSEADAKLIAALHNSWPQIRAALAEPQAQPLAWAVYDESGQMVGLYDGPCEGATPLFARPLPEGVPESQRFKVENIKALLQEAADYHDYQESCADAMGFDSSTDYHERSRKTLEAMLAAAPAEGGESE